MNGLTCLDMVKEFKELNDQKNPFFKEACKYFQQYVMTLRTMAEPATVSSVRQSQHKSQKFMLYYLQYLYDLIFVKTRDMQN